jgi:hypothetical protein
LYAGDLYSEDINGLGFGFSAGYGKPTGEYSSEFRSSGVYGFELIPFIHNWFMIDLDASYRRSRLKKSRESTLTDISAGLGGRLFYKIGFIAPYAGAVGGGDYLRLDAKITGRTSVSYKPVVTGKAGILIFFPRGITGDVRGEYSYREMSGKPYTSVAVSGGLIFRFGGTSERAPENVKIPPSFAADFSAGLTAYNDRRLSDAEKYFRKVPKDDVLYSESGRYLREISDLQRVYAQALTLIKQDKLIESIRLLEQVAPKMREAEEDLSRVRNRLKEKIDDLEKIGIAAYENREYKRCISIMKTISAIDPDNKIVRVYLPRAVKRDQALSQDSE